MADEAIPTESDSAVLSGEKGPDLNRDGVSDLVFKDGEPYIQVRLLWWILTGALSTLVLIVGGFFGLAN